MKFNFFPFDWTNRPYFMIFTVHVQYKKMLQYSTTTVKYSTVQLSAHTGISDSLSYFHYFLPCLDLRKPRHRTLSYPTKTVRHFQNHELHRKMPQPRFPRSIFRKFPHLRLPLSYRKYPCFECSLSFISWFLCVA